MTDGEFDASARLTPANAVTMARLLLCPVLWFLIVDRGADWWTFGFGWVIAWTDGLDGWLARAYGATRAGAFLDPLADKFLVIGSLVALVINDRFHWLPVALITAREVAVSVFRSYYGRRGLAVPARYWAKVKTIVQQVALALALLPPTAELLLADIVLWIAVGFTLVTGAQYLLDGSKATTTSAT